MSRDELLELLRHNKLVRDAVIAFRDLSNEPKNPIEEAARKQIKEVLEQTNYFKTREKVLGNAPLKWTFYDAGHLRQNYLELQEKRKKLFKDELIFLLKNDQEVRDALLATATDVEKERDELTWNELFLKPLGLNPQRDQSSDESDQEG